VTRRLAVVPDVEDAPDCLLCGKGCETYADLCDRCAGVFARCADRIAARVAAALVSAADPEIIPGQLTLEDRA